MSQTEAALPDFSVFATLARTDQYEALHSKILQVTDVEPFDVKEYMGLVYVHWSARDLGEAKSLVDALDAVVDRPDLVFLQIMSRVHGAEFITLKDARRRSE